MDDAGGLAQQLTPWCLQRGSLFAQQRHVEQHYLPNWLQNPVPWLCVMSSPWQENRWIIKKALKNDKSEAKFSYFAFWSSAVLFGVAVARTAVRFPPTVKAAPFQQSLRQDQHYRFRKLLTKSLIQSFGPQETCIWFSCVQLATALGAWYQVGEEPSCCCNRCLDSSKALLYLLQIRT